MWPPEFLQTIKAPEQRLAWLVAIIADSLQLLAFPLFMEGGASPFNDALDLLVAVLMVRILGWHWAFLPTVMAEVLPGLDLFPTWTAAVFFVTRGQVHSRPAQPEILPPEPVSPSSY
jgi:hypothetical protein